jgi:metal-sulfur cluster biosynthetic enzyme
MTELSVEERTEKLMADLRQVIDPELGMNVVELGLIREVQMNEDNAHVTMILTTPFCPYAPAMISQVEKTSEESLGIPVTVEMGTEMWDPSMMEEGAGGDWGLF